MAMLPPTPPEASSRRRGQRLEFLRICLLALLSAFIWTAHAHKWSWAEWQVPTDYGGDSMEILARIKIAAEGDTIPLRSQTVTRLGAPLGAMWNSYPTPEKAVLLGLGAIARLSNVYVAANAGLLFGQILNAVVFYWVVRRWLRVRWEWSLAGGLLFACTYATFHRGLTHYFFFLTWVVPLGLLACWLIARSSRLQWRNAGGLTCLGAGVALGCQSPYYLYFWLPLMGWAWLTQWFGARRTINLRIGVAAVALSGAMFFVMNFEYWFHVQSGDALPLLERNYGGTERYALKPVEMFIPPAVHNWDSLAFFGKRYNRWSEWRGEIFLPYLGLVGIVALAWLVGCAVRRLLVRRAPPGEALAVAWLVAFAGIGGITNLLSFFGGLTVFRATNRIAIYIAAIVLVFLVVRLSRLTARWRAPWRFGAALALSTLGVLDQLPSPVSDAARQATAVQVANDRAYGRQLEAAFSPGSMIFQLPVIGFPEVVAPWRLGDYEHFRPFLNTDSLRFSYGVTKHRPRGRWQQDLPLNNTARLVRELEELGFAGLYLNRKGFADQADELLGELQALGYPSQLTSASGQQVVVPLHPVAKPRLPLARTLTAGRGWHQQSREGIRWAYEPDASLLYQNPYSHPIRVELTLVLGNSSAIALRQEGRTLATLTSVGDKQTWRLPAIELQPGVNTLVLQSDFSPTRAPTGYLQTFGLHQSTIRILAE